MADTNKANNAYTSSSDGVATMSGGAASQDQRSDYKSSSRGGGLGISAAEIQGKIPSLNDIGAVKLAREALKVGETAAQAALKISLAEIGVWRTLFTYGGKSRTLGVLGQENRYPQSINPFGPENNYHAQSPVYDRFNPENSYVFKCGDYFLPISFNYSVSAQKKTAISQLVDGPEIIQQTYKGAKVINVNIKIEQKTSRYNITYGDMPSLAFMKAISPDAGYEDNYEYEGSEYEDQYVPAVDEIENALVGLGIALRSLYEEQDVFTIEQKEINTELGVTNVFMEQYSYSTTPGSTQVNISMTLREVNMDDQIQFGNQGQSTIDSTSSAGGGAQ